jgi:hypothetical protein
MGQEFSDPGVSRDEFVMRVMRVFAAVPNEHARDALWWRCDGEYAPITFLITCSDEFFWGCADSEHLTAENIGAFEKACADAKAATKFGDIYGPMLFCARIKKERPQGAAYPRERDLWPLFDACGPEREIGLGNPYPPGETMGSRVQPLSLWARLLRKVRGK